MTDTSGDGPPRSLLIAAVAVAAAAIIAVLVIAAVRQLPEQLQPVPIPSIPAPRAESRECGALMAALPESLGDYRRAPTAEPAPAGAAGSSVRRNSSSERQFRSSTPCSGSR